MQTLEPSFAEVVTLIQGARQRVYQAANTALIDLYWQVGEYIAQRVDSAGWGKSVVQQLADYLGRQQLGLRGFSASSLWRMKQFYEAYRAADPVLATLLRELSWSHNTRILGRCKTAAEREFYVRLSSKEHWSVRDLDRQLNGMLFGRIALSKARMSAALTDIHPDAPALFRDSYLVEFLELPESHTEANLQQALIRRLKDFLLELGRDFSFVGENYLLQVGS